jgi:putative membrane protein
MRIFFYALLALIVLFGISFAALNAESVTLHYYMGTLQLPLSFLLAFCLTLGIVLGCLLSLSLFLRAKREIFELKAKLKRISAPTP